MSSSLFNQYAQQVPVTLGIGDDDDHVRHKNCDGVIDDFTFDCAESLSSPIPADQIFHNGKIRPTNVQFQQPLLFFPPATISDPPNPNLLAASDETSNTTSTTGKISQRKALRRLFTEDSRRHHNSSQSDDSVSDELITSLESVSLSSSNLDSVPSNNYCVWEPKIATNEKGRNSSSSLSSSRRWRLRDLLTRNISGKDSRSVGIVNKNLSKINDDDDDGENKKAVVEETPPQQQQQQQQTVRNSAMKEAGSGRRRSSYLPYRQELIGVFGSRSSSSSTLLQRF